MTLQWVEELEQMPNTALFLKRHYQLVRQLKELDWLPDNGLAGFRFALLESIGHLQFWRIKQLDYLLAHLAYIPDFALHGIMLLLFDLGQFGSPEIKTYLEQHRHTVLYQQRLYGNKADVPLWYILLPLEQRPDLSNSSHVYEGQAKPVPPHASVLLKPAPISTRTNLSQTQIFTEKLQTYNQFAFLILRVEPMLEQQLIFTNHVEQTRLSPEYTGTILEAVYQCTYGFSGLRVVLLDAIDHPIDSSASLFQLLTKRALQKALNLTEI